MEVEIPEEECQQNIQAYKGNLLEHTVIINSEEDLHDLVNYLLHKKGILDKFLEKRASLVCKLEFLKHDNVILAPDGYCPRKDSKIKHIVYFKNCLETRAVLSKHLFSKFLFTKFNNYEKGFILKSKIGKHLLREKAKNREET